MDVSLEGDDAIVPHSFPPSLPPSSPINTPESRQAAIPSSLLITPAMTKPYAR